MRRPSGKGHWSVHGAILSTNGPCPVRLTQEATRWRQGAAAATQARPTDWRRPKRNKPLAALRRHDTEVAPRGALVDMQSCGAGLD